MTKETSKETQEDIINILHCHRHELFRFCRMLTGSDWDADDLVQETLIKLFSYGKKASVPTAKAYVFRTAANAWFDMCRKKKVEVEAFPTDLELAAPQSRDLFEAEDRLGTLLRILSPSQAAVLLLVDVFQFTPKETAAMIESTEGAVRAMLHRSRERMRQFKPYAFGEDYLDRSNNFGYAPAAPLIERFLTAFRRNDFHEISRVYIEMTRNKVEVVRLEGTNKFIFRFRDPEGNLCVVESEK